MEIEKVYAIGEEVEASFCFIKEGIRALHDSQGIVFNNHVVLQLFSSGFERLVKVLILIRLKHVEHEYPQLEGRGNFFQNFDNGHGIQKMLSFLLTYSEGVQLMNMSRIVVEDLNYLKNDANFKHFIELITDFSKYERYHYVDTIVKKDIRRENVFSRFRKFMYGCSEIADVSNMSHEDEERLIIRDTIITVEKGVRAISRFFTHGLGNDGRMHYGSFSTFIYLNDEDLGWLKYLNPKVDLEKEYQPWSFFSFQYFLVRLNSKKMVIKQENCEEWPFRVGKVRVFNYKDGRYRFVKINHQIFALNGNAQSKFKIPFYIASDYLKPRQNAPFLDKKARELT